jgi:hypothetical protein
VAAAMEVVARAVGKAAAWAVAKAVAARAHCHAASR